ncbi:MAG: hypothetical protein CMI51_13350 [Paracoccus sp.]|nr:hypothetical protein [Paracoccus sp. (in: a-proteobacteria)]
MISCQHDLRLRIAVVDPCSSNGYDLSDLAAGGMGGTEASILRVAASLKPRFDVAHYQNGRRSEHLSDVGRLCPLDQIDRQPALQHDALIVINRWKVALRLRKLFPQAPILLWLHVYPGRHNRGMGALLRAANIDVICVSRSHAKRFLEFVVDGSEPRTHIIYNPIADELVPDTTVRDPNRLLFASSPHKGLAQVFAQFAALKRHLPDLTLAIADPGYLKWDTGPAPEGAVFLGSLSHAALVQEMRSCLCLFYPQTTFAETFGLVLTEANAVGTPVLVHDGLGANAEIVADMQQRVNGHDDADIRARIISWRQSLPRVTANPGFRLSRVTEAWHQLLVQTALTRTHSFKSCRLTA